MAKTFDNPTLTAVRARVEARAEKFAFVEKRPASVTDSLYLLSLIDRMGEALEVCARYGCTEASHNSRCASVWPDNPVNWCGSCRANGVLHSLQSEGR